MENLKNRLTQDSAQHDLTDIVRDNDPVEDIVIVERPENNEENDDESVVGVTESAPTKMIINEHDEKRGLCPSLASLLDLFTLSWDMDHKQYITENDIKFSIQQLGLLPNEMQLNISVFRLIVSSPSGRLYPYEAKLIRRPDNLSSKVNCSFRAIECGEYTIDVKFCEGSIRGCPFNIYISRDYQTVRDRRPIVSWKIQDLDKSKSFKPWGLCCNTRTEQIYVAERNNHRIFVYNLDGQFSFLFGKFGDEEGCFNQPVALAYDSTHDRILVTDRGNNRVQIFSSCGNFKSGFGKLGSNPGEFSSPWGVAVSNDGMFISVADSKNKRVQIFDSEGSFVRLFEGSFGYLKGISFDFEGHNVIVSDWLQSAVFKINIEMTECTAIMNKSIVGRPAGLMVDAAGNVLVCDSAHNCIVVVDWKYEFTGELIQNTGACQIFRPKDLAYIQGGFFALLDSCGKIKIC